MAISTDMLTAFIRVAEHRGVSAAAAELGVAKSVVSKRIAQLEAAVKATLFSRSTRKVALTPAGEAYLDFARRALHEVAAAEERLRDLRVQLSGRIRVTAPVSWGQRVLAKCLPDFLLQHPAIEVELLLDDRMMDLAVERIDIALRWSSVAAPDLSAIPVAQVNWRLTAAPAYLASTGWPQQPQDLAQHVCLTYWRDSSDDTWLLEQALPEQRLEQVQVRVHSRYHVNNPEAVADAALAGLGIALLPDYLCDDALADTGLVRLLPGWVPVTKFGTGITAVATPERLRITRNQALLSFLTHALAG
jgi:DNA-binding transcriptional LysR family regulator